MSVCLYVYIYTTCMHNLRNLDVIFGCACMFAQTESSLRFVRQSLAGCLRAARAPRALSVYVLSSFVCLLACFLACLLACFLVS